MAEYIFTDYFKSRVLARRPCLRKDWCIYVIENAVRSEPQDRNRHRFWAAVPALGGRYLRVITLADKVTIHNAFSGPEIRAMRLNYFADTDSLYIDLAEQPSVRSEEVAEGVVLDYDADGNLVGIDIDNASAKVDLKRLILDKLPAAVETVAA